MPKSCIFKTSLLHKINLKNTLHIVDSKPERMIKTMHINTLKKSTTVSIEKRQLHKLHIQKHN